MDILRIFLETTEYSILGDSEDSLARVSSFLNRTVNILSHIAFVITTQSYSSTIATGNLQANRSGLCPIKLFTKRVWCNIVP